MDIFLNSRAQYIFSNNIFLLMSYSKLQQGIDKKRKAKTTKKMDHPKKRRTNSVNNTTINGGTNVTSSQLISSILPTSDVSDHNILTNCNKTREEKRTEAETQPT